MNGSIAWDRLDRPDWEDLFARAPRSALVQGWAWGEAKRAVDGWRPRRGVISLDGRAVALAQVLERRIGGVVTLARLNRGPTWLEDGLSRETRLAVVALLRRRWRWWRGAALALAPELPEGTALAGCLRQGRMAPWGSAWLDLDRDPADLRRRLDGKWRNKLGVAERGGLAVAISPDLLGWLLGRYRELLTERGFGATPPALVTALAARGWRPDDLTVLRAETADGDGIAGILLARHGCCATYLIGWSGPEGRKRKATNLLLWRGIEMLRQQGVRALDLGGIDAVLTPGIAEFKRGMGGDEYRLAGEFIAL